MTLVCCIWCMRILLAQWHSLECFGSLGTASIEIVWTVTLRLKSQKKSLRAKQEHTSSCWYNWKHAVKEKMLFFFQLSTKTINDSTFFSVYFLTLVLLWPLKLSYGDILIKAEKALLMLPCCRLLPPVLQKAFCFPPVLPTSRPVPHLGRPGH